jgi:hypothetical protein
MWAFYLHFKLSPIYDRDWSEGLRESPAMKVLIVSKIQDTQVGSVRMVLSVAFPLKKCHFSWTRLFLRTG